MAQWKYVHASAVSPANRGSGALNGVPPYIMIGSATAQNTRPTPCPVANSIANQEKYENAGLASLPPRRIEPSFVTATNMHTAKHKNAHSTIHQLQYWVTNRAQHANRVDERVGADQRDA